MLFVRTPKLYLQSLDLDTHLATTAEGETAQQSTKKEASPANAKLQKPMRYWQVSVHHTLSCEELKLLN